ncbi:FixH family protein [Luteimonas sp. e5]
MNTPARKAWREPMVWLVVGLPALVVVAGFITLYLAITNSGGGSVTNPGWRMGQIQQADLGPDQRAHALGLRVLLREHDGHLEVLPMAGKISRQRALQLLAEHPTDSAQDRSLSLPPGGAGWVSQQPFSELDQHDWKFSLGPGDQSWRLRGRLTRGQRSVVLAPALGED